MSAYEPYDAPPRRHYREDHRRPDPRYEPQDAYYRASPSTRHELVPRAREDSDLSVEEIRRDFPPPGYSRDIRRARSAEPGYDDYYAPSSSRELRTRRKPGSIYYEEERTRKRVLTKQEKILAAVLGGVIAAGAKEAWDRKEAKDEGSDVIHRNLTASAALAAGGALAGYQGADFYNKRSAKEEKRTAYITHKERDGRTPEYSDDEEDPRSRKGNKNFLESALSAAGLGGAIKALTGGGSEKDDRRSETRSRRGSFESTRSRKSEDTPANRMQKAAKASLVAGAAEAFRVAKEPGGWKGEKMKRVLTAAVGAATIDAAHDSSKDSKRHMAEAVIGGLLGNRMIHGSRKDIEEDKTTGRSRSRSRSRSGGGNGATGLAALATAGLGALGAKKIMDKDRSRSRSRRGSPDSYGSRSPSPRHKRSRSRSVVDSARRSLAKIGLGNGPDDRRSDDYHDDDRSSTRKSRHHDDRYDDDYTSRGYMRGGRGDSYYDDDRSADSRRRSRSRRGGRSGSVSSSDLGDSDDDEKRARKMKDRRHRRHADDDRY